MTDFSKYKNVSLHKDTYEKADKLSNELLDVKISKAQVITLGVNLVEMLHNKKLLKGSLNQISTELLQRKLIGNNAVEHKVSL
jgi:hypothetical protein